MHKGHNNTIQVYSVAVMTHSPVSKVIRFNKIVTKGFSVVIGSLLGLFLGGKKFTKIGHGEPPKIGHSNLPVNSANMNPFIVFIGKHRCDAGVMQV